MPLYRYSRQTFSNILCLPLSRTEFYGRVAEILDKDPYFSPGYLEMLSNAEERNDRYLYERILRDAVFKMSRLYIDRSLRKEVLEFWSNLEKESFKKLLILAIKKSKITFFKKIVLLFQFLVMDQFLVIKTILSPKEGRYLKYINVKDIADIKREILKLPMYWWQLDTSRQESIPYHQHTYSLILRNRKNPELKYTPIDGPHESLPNFGVKRFVKVHELILRIAEDLHLGLGRVVIVNLGPKRQAYRHCDTEVYLQGRLRYHLVVQADGGDLLESGDEVASVKEGELWYIDNKVMHRALNYSDSPRIHIIFDGFPLS